MDRAAGRGVGHETKLQVIEALARRFQYNGCRSCLKNKNQVLFRRGRSCGSYLAGIAEDCETVKHAFVQIYTGKKLVKDRVRALTNQ